MIKKLQKKFVFYTTCISMVVLVLIVIFINVLNYNSMVKRPDIPMNFLNDKNFNFNSFENAPNKLPKEADKFTELFLVHTDKQLNIMDIHIALNSTISSVEAKNYAEKAINSDNTTGLVDNYKFRRNTSNNGFVYTFVEIGRELNSYYSYMQLTILVSFFAFVMIFLLSCFFSKKVVRPIAESYERQKEFITNVSHELKTPLAIINANVDVIEIEQVQNEWTTSIKSQIKRLNELVTKLVCLTKLDEKKDEKIKTQFSLSDALNETVDEFFALAQSQNINIVTSCKGNITYFGEEIAIRNLFNILIENAIKYSPEDKDIKIELKHTRNCITFSIENHCNNIKSGNYNTWFERFYREDKSRNSISNSFGLGLSIAKSICDVHNIKIQAKSTNGKTIVITANF